MSIGSRLTLCLLAPLVFVSAARSQQAPVQAQSSNSIDLDVVVTPKSGPPVAGLQQQDFTLIDNKASQPITSFQALGGSDAPIEVTLVVDAVNTSYTDVAHEREEIDGFLRANGGHLAYPTAFAFFTDTGLQIQNNSSTDGNQLSSYLDSHLVGLRDLPHSSGFHGELELFQLSLNAIHSLVANGAGHPGRRIILWISPGWPLISGPGVELSSKERQALFANVVGLSGELRQARVTLYSIDPIGPTAAGIRTLYYQEYLKGVSKPGQAEFGNLALQVLAVQSGGLALTSNNDLANLLNKCLADTESYYELSFAPSPGERRDEYHHLEIRLAKPGLTARTRDGYYSQP